MSQKWIIKDSLDQVSGPFDTPEVIRRIHQGLVTEEDFLASYPEGKWIPVTKNQVFFDEMLASISKSSVRSSDKPSAPKTKSEAVHDKNIENDKTEALSQTLKLDKTKALKKTKVTVSATSDDIDKTQIIDIESENFDGNDAKNDYAGDGKTKIKRNLPVSESKLPHQLYSQEGILDLRKHKYQTFVDKKRKEISIIILLVTFLAAGWFFWPVSEDDIKGDNFKLRAPRFNKNPISKDIEIKAYQVALSKIHKGSFKNFRDAHNELIKILENNSQNIDALSLLCFTNYHLWEFTQKTSKDLFAISTIAKKAAEIDRFGEKGRVCRFVDLSVRGKYQEAQKVVDDILDSEEGATSVLFSYFNGLLKIFKKEFIAAESYLSAAITRGRQQSNSKVNNEYAVMWVAHADANLKLGKANLAYQSALRAIRINPDFVDALLLKGIIEYRSQRKNKLAKITLQKSLSYLDTDKPNKKKLSDAYVVLAEIALFERRRNDALEYAIAAYNYNPGNSVAKNLAIELGGNRKVGKKTVLSQQLVIEGEQNLQESGCASAQAFFKEAFKLDQKNGYAALKTAQCLWELSFSVDAIEWIEKAIQADPSLTEAYVTAAKFYMDRYNFDSSLQVLLKAKKVSPRSYEVYRGLAQLELKRDNPQLAIEYAKMALKIYDADTDTLIVMARALYELNQNQEAFQYIARASENDSRNVDVHTMYGKILYKIQGIFASQEYLRNRIASYPLEASYRVTLAEIYFEDQKYQEAEVMAREAIEYDEKSKAAYMILGKSLKAKNDKTNALNYFLDAFSLDPSDVEPLFEAGQLYIDIRKFDEAIKQFERVLKMNNQYPAIYYNLAKVYFAQRKMKKALEYCRLEIETAPNRDECYILSAEAYFYKGTQEKDKLTVLNQKRISPNDVEKNENEKKITYDRMLDFYKLCTNNYQRAIDIAPQTATLFIDLSRCYRFAGEFDMSQKMVEKALEIERGNPAVWRENGLLFEQKGEYALALEAYKQYLTLNPSAADRSDIVQQMKMLEAKIKPN
jgi:tetratricopeptide (TPR) repeat protein